MGKKEDMDALDRWERQEIVRRATATGANVLHVIEDVKEEDRERFLAIVLSPDSSMEEPQTSKLLDVGSNPAQGTRKLAFERLEDRMGGAGESPVGA